jgi:tetratricopeptide (TPR) repeat protein
VTLFGLEPGPHHLVSLGLHAANAALLLLLLRALTGALWPSALAASLFALHPLRAESVAWVAERKDVLSALFGLLALHAYAGYARRPGAARAAAVCGLLALGLMAKPMLVTLPLVLLVLDWWPLGRWAAGAGRRALLLEKAPLLALAAASGAVTLLAQQRGGAVNLMQGGHAALRAGNAVVSAAGYLGASLWPSGLALYYPLAAPPAPWAVGGAGLLLAGLTAASWRWRRSRPWFGAGWLWFLVTLAPVSGLVRVGEQASADRYTYLPMIGGALAAAWSLWRLARTARPAVAAAVAAASIAAAFALAALTWRQSGFWRDDATVFGHALAVTRDNWLVEGNYGLVLYDQGRYAEAARHLRESVRVNPSADAYRMLGNALKRAGDERGALGSYRQALRLDPRSADVLYEIGNVLANRGQLAEAAVSYRAALVERPHMAEARSNLGAALALLGQEQAAVAQFREALRARPEYAGAHFNLALSLVRLGRSVEAADELRETLRLAPAFPGAREELERVLAGNPAVAGPAGRPATPRP